MSHISIIVAIAENFAIGKNNQLLFHLSDDLKRFRQITTGHPVIMGRNTLLSLPKWPLPGRHNIVITDKPEDAFPGCEIVFSVEDALKLVPDEAEVFIIGGGSVYRQFFPIATRLYLTLVHKIMDADTFFPEVIYEEWEEISREEHFDEINQFSYTYLTLERDDVPSPLTKGELKGD
jgi:dihydrofolate reductase